MAISVVATRSTTDTRAVALAIAIHVVVIGYIVFLAFVPKEMPVDPFVQPHIVTTVVFPTESPPPPKNEDVHPRTTPFAGPQTVEPMPLQADTGEAVNPQPISKVMLPYPVRALTREKEGQVILSVSIDASGKVTSVILISADPPGWGFEENAIQSVRGWKYAASAGARRDIRVVVNYTLKN